MPALVPIGLRRTVILRVMDLLVIIGVLVGVDWAYHESIPGDLRWQLMVAVGCLVLAIFELGQCYSVLHRSGLGQWCLRVTAAWGMVLGLFFAGVFAFHLQDSLSRLIIGSWALIAWLGLILTRLVLYVVMSSRHRSGISAHRVVLAGDDAYCRRLARHFTALPTLGLRVVGICTDKRFGSEFGRQVPVLGTLADLPVVARQQGAHRVVVSAPIDDHHTIGRVFTTLADEPIILQYAPDLERFSLLGFQATDYGGQPVFTLTDSPLSRGDVVVKWLEDRVLGALIALFALPLMAVIAVIIKLSSPGPVLFIQERHGLYGKPIRVLKFRTMRPPKDEAERLAIAAGMEKTASGRFKQASSGDNRITWIGNILRKSSLDELPQIINVLRGEMSLVGPRPHPIGLNLQYATAIDHLMRRHYVKPGMTGLAQISGARGETRTVDDMRRRVQYDLEYMREWSLWLDLKILALTPIKGILNGQP